MFDIYQLHSGLANTDYRTKLVTDLGGVETMEGIYDTYLTKWTMDETTLNAIDFQEDLSVETGEEYEELKGDSAADPVEMGDTTWDIYIDNTPWDAIATAIDTDKATLANEKDDVERVLCSQV